VKVSIITAVLNGGRAIGATLDSVREQDHPDIEHVIVDGASADDTLEVVRQRGSRVTTVVSERDSGVYAAINRGIGLATGDIVLCLHAGDTYQHSGVISRIAREFADPSVDMVFAELVMTDPHQPDRVYRHYATPGFRAEEFARGLMPAHPTLAVRREVYLRFGGYDPTYRVAGDFEFFVRTIYASGMRYRYLPEVLVRMPLGGLSNRRWWVPVTTTFELQRACRQHGVSTNWLRLLFRIFVKWRTSVLRQDTLAGRTLDDGTVQRMRVLLFANTEWYLYNFRRSLAQMLRSRGHEVILVAPAGPYIRKLEELGFRCYEAPMGRRSLNPLRELRLVGWLWRLLRRERIEVVHGFTIKCVVYASIAGRIAAVRGGLPVRVNSVTGMGYVFSSDDLAARLLRPLVKSLLRFSLSGSGSHLILQNRDDRSFFTDIIGLAAGQTSLIAGSGVDLGRFAPADPPAGPEDHGRPVRVLLAARLLWDKGIAEYIEAARALRAAGKGYRLLLAGMPDSGNPAAVPEVEVRGWVDEGLVDWLGHVEDMPALFRTIDIVVLPSYREGFPKTLIEAAACGLPLITTDVPGCREVITDGVEGLLVPARDGAALAAAIDRLAADPVLRRQQGAAARLRAVAEFDDRSVNERTVALYEQTLLKTRGRL
jgi:glycosyltransferase involved in cell wall biosynthesis